MRHPTSGCPGQVRTSAPRLDTKARASARGARRPRLSSAHESTQQPHLADEAGGGIELGAEIEGSDHLDAFGGGPKPPTAVVRIDHDDVLWPVGVGLTERADRDGLRAENEERGLGSERRRQVSRHANGLTAQTLCGLREGDTQRAAARIEVGEPKRGCRLRRDDRRRKGDHHRDRRARDAPPQRVASWPKPSAFTMMRNTSVLSRKPRTRSAPGPIAVRTTSSPVCTPCGAALGRFPTRSIAPGTSRYFSLAIYVRAGPSTAGTNGPSVFGRNVS